MRAIAFAIMLVGLGIEYAIKKHRGEVEMEGVDAILYGVSLIGFFICIFTGW